MNKLGQVISAHYREGSFLNIAKYVFKFPKSLGAGHFVLCFFCAFFVVTVTGAGRDPTLTCFFLLSQWKSFKFLGLPYLVFMLILNFFGPGYWGREIFEAPMPASAR